MNAYAERYRSFIEHQIKKFVQNLTKQNQKITKHPSHFNYKDAINISKKLNPKKTILTNLHVDLDYNKLKKKLPSNIVPAYDGLNFNF